MEKVHIDEQCPVCGTDVWASPDTNHYDEKGRRILYDDDPWECARGHRGTVGTDEDSPHYWLREPFFEDDKAGG